MRKVGEVGPLGQRSKERGWIVLRQAQEVSSGPSSQRFEYGAEFEVFVRHDCDLSERASISLTQRVDWRRSAVWVM
jgi:hypothetical protein